MNQKPTNEQHVFIIEDDSYMQVILKLCLSKSYYVSVFDNGMAAMAAMQSGTVPDIIITDLNTPFLNGLDLIRQVKASSFFSSVPIIILTGDHSSESRTKCLSEGADDFVMKPFNPKELAIRVNIVLKRTVSQDALMHA